MAFVIVSKVHEGETEQVKRHERKRKKTRYYGEKKEHKIQETGGGYHG